MPTSQFPKVVPTRNPLRSGPVSPPTHLDEEEQALFRSIVNEFRIDDAGGVELLVTACEAHARCRVCRETIDKEGMTVKLLKTEASARGQYLASLRALNLEPPQPSKRWIAR